MFTSVKHGISLIIPPHICNGRDTTKTSVHLCVSPSVCHKFVVYDITFAIKFMENKCIHIGVDS